MSRKRTRVDFAKAWAEAPSRQAALKEVALYLALRFWAMVMGIFPMETNLRTGRLLGRIWWTVSKRHRQRAMDNLRPAFGQTHSERQMRRIARRSFQHFAQLYLVELVMTPRLINKWSWARYVELGEIGPAIRELLRARGTIMITPHFGNYELLGFTIAELGLPLISIMRPLDNPLINDYLVATREASGLSLLFKKGAMGRADDILAEGDTLCFIADQDAGRKAVFSDFFHRKAAWYKSIGLLAMRHRVPIVVGAATRTGRGFRYRMDVERIIQPEEWDAQENPLQWVTDEYAGALERLIRRAPEQYLWVHQRWKTRPPAERKAAEAAATSSA